MQGVFCINPALLYNCYKVQGSSMGTFMENWHKEFILLAPVGEREPNTER